MRLKFCHQSFTAQLKWFDQKFGCEPDLFFKYFSFYDFQILISFFNEKKTKSGSIKEISVFLNESYPAVVINKIVTRQKNDSF